MNFFWQNYSPSSVIFDFFGWPIRWYAIFILVGALFGVWLMKKTVQKFRLNFGDLDWLIIWSAVAGLFFARLYYVIYDWRFFVENPFEIFRINNGDWGFLALCSIFWLFFGLGNTK